MTTEPRRTVERNNARTRWFHAAVYATVLALLLTGWWLTLGQEGRASPLAGPAAGLPGRLAGDAPGWPAAP